jgi:hypothetical protein
VGPEDRDSVLEERVEEARDRSSKVEEQPDRYQAKDRAEREPIPRFWAFDAPISRVDRLWHRTLPSNVLGRRRREQVERASDPQQQFSLGPTGEPGRAELVRKDLRHLISEFGLKA